MDKKLLNINFQKSFIEYFPYWDEKLFIDMKIKEDEQSREKAKEYAWYLEELKNYVEFEDEKEVDEIIEFLKSKPEALKNVSQEEKREYMEMKFDILDWKVEIEKSYDDNADDFYILKNNNDQDKVKELKKYLKDSFPILNNQDDIFFNHYFDILQIISYKEKFENSMPDDFKDEDEKNQAEYDRHIEKQEYENDLKEYFLNFNYNNPIIGSKTDIEKKKYILISILFPYWNKIWIISEYALNYETSFINWKMKRLKIKNIKQNIESKLDLFNRFIFLEEDLSYEREFVSKIFPKTNLFCDYRFFDREMIK